MKFLFISISTSFLLETTSVFLFRRGFAQSIFPLFVFASLFISCKRNENCLSLNLVPTSPYSNPVWNPDGTVLGFNHQVLKSVSVINPCHPYYSCSFYSDSNGFWLINKDGTGMHRVTSFQLDAPVWSPDGKWIAFCNGGQISKMQFDGANFDTSHILTLTSKGTNHFFPSWSPQGDTIYFDSDEANPGKPFQIYKMASDGTGLTRIGDKGIDSVYSRYPFCTAGKNILHIRGDSLSTHVFSMDTNGDQVLQLTNNISPNIYINNPASFNNKIFYQDKGIWTSNMDGSTLTRLCINSTLGFSIAKDGVIAYVNFSNTDTAMVDKTHGVIWLMNADGSNPEPFMYNIY